MSQIGKPMKEWTEPLSAPIPAPQPEAIPVPEPVPQAEPVPV
jgi:hypothetical protein